MRQKVAMALVSLCAAGHVSAAEPGAVSVAVASIKATQSCTYFQESAGRGALVATPWMVASASAWRTWWVKDCVSNFATMRSSLQAALASSGKLRVGAPARYTVVVNITDVSGGDGPAPVAPDGKDFAVARSYMVASMDVSLRDSSGRVVFGGLLTKKLEVGSDVKVGGFEARSNSSGEAAYGKMQNELALAAARIIAFHLAPIEVVNVDGREVELNYGSPLLGLGDLVSIVSPDHRATVRYRVSSTASGSAMADVYSDGNVAAITAGSIGTYIEADSAAANGRRFKKVDLP